MAHAFVTGGSGFIGRALIRRLVFDGHTVRALVRRPEAAQQVAALGAEPVSGELTDAGTWQAAVQGSDVLFHLAAETDVAADASRHQSVTVGGTRAALDAARHAGVARFILCGSEAALLAGDPLIEVDEHAPLRPDSEAAYCAAKATSEALVMEANAPGFDTVSIRPRFVWGPESILTEGLVAAVEAGQFIWIDGAHQITDITYVDNAVEGLVLGWLRGTPGQAYFITDQHRVQLRDFLEATFAIYGVSDDIPEIDAETARQNVPVPIRWFLGQPCTLRTDKAIADLGYSPVVSFDEGMAAVRSRVGADQTAAANRFTSASAV